MTKTEFDQAVDREVAMLVARLDTQPFRAVVCDVHGKPQIVNVEAADVHEAAHRAEEFGRVTALWLTR